jgi:hypothetical protein
MGMPDSCPSFTQPGRAYLARPVVTERLGPHPPIGGAFPPNDRADLFGWL